MCNDALLRVVDERKLATFLTALRLLGGEQISRSVVFGSCVPISGM